MGSSRISPSATETRARLSGPAAAVEQVLAQTDLRGKTLAVALSGGVDSVVLLNLLKQLAPRYGYALRAIHVDHGLSANSVRWAAFCRRLCRDRGVPLEVRRVKVGERRGIGIEAAARAARRAALARARAHAVALAHHLDDQAETVLMNLLRGTGLRGASGMPVRGTLLGKAVVRPLLAVPRTAIVRYARAHGLQWVEDEMNDDPSLTRGYLRQRVLPLLEQRYPRWREALARAARHFAEADALLRRHAAMPPALVLRDQLAERGLRAPTERRLADMLRQLSGRGARTAIRHDGVVLHAYRGKITLERPAPPVQFAPIKWSGERRLRLPSPAGELRLRPARGAGIDRARLEAGEVHVRQRRGGERLQLDPARPRRTLKNLFQEAGVPPWWRERLPLLCCDGELVWVPGLGIDARYRTAPGAPGLVPEWRPGDGLSQAQALVFTRFDRGA
ncbi:MAG TPA: tRNA lysidine(34) synthetase TilS [Burkholderiales bacterium]|nr:tRNA lysidine(34) synthetase TilS [Burkholderiales bacterium]